MPAKRVFDDPTVGERVRHAYVELGHDIRRIAADQRMSLRTVICCMRHFGVPSRPVGPTRKMRDTAQMMERMRERGTPIAGIARRFGVARRTVYESLRRYGYLGEVGRDGRDLLAVLLTHEGVTRDARDGADVAP